MNILRIGVLAPLVGAKYIKEWAPGTLFRLAVTSVAAVAVPGLLIGTGMLMGAYGHEDGARVTIRIGAFLGMVLAIWVALRTVIPVYMAAFGSEAAKKVLGDWAEVIEPEMAKSLARKLSGILAFLASAYLVAMYAPLWSNPSLLLVPMIASICLAFISSAGWFGGTFPKVVITLWATSVLIGSLLWFVPGVPTIVGAYSEQHLGGLVASSDRLGKFEAASHESDKKIANLDQKLLTSKLARLASLRNEAIEKCGGVYCSDKDKAEAAKILADTEALKKGTYWNKAKSMDGTVNAAPPDENAAQANTLARIAAMKNGAHYEASNANSSVTNAPPPSDKDTNAHADAGAGIPKKHRVPGHLASQIQDMLK